MKFKIAAALAFVLLAVVETFASITVTVAASYANHAATQRGYTDYEYFAFTIVDMPFTMYYGDGFDTGMTLGTVW